MTAMLQDGDVREVSTPIKEGTEATSINPETEAKTMNMASEACSMNAVSEACSANVVTEGTGVLLRKGKNLQYVFVTRSRVQRMEKFSFVCANMIGAHAYLFTPVETNMIHCKTRTTLSGHLGLVSDISTNMFISLFLM